jgi:Polyketide cyclase / dehydrase and lipid transport
VNQHATEARSGSAPQQSGEAVRIDEGAPILLHGQVEIAAGRGAVWDVISSIAGWPDWNPDISFASLEGKLEPGVTFRWKSGGYSLLSNLVRENPPAEIAWTGRSMGINVVHLYRLEDRGDKTLVRSEESVAGFPARLFQGPIRRRMDAAIQSQLQHLKAESERRATER